MKNGQNSEVIGIKELNVLDMILIVFIWITIPPSLFI